MVLSAHSQYVHIHTKFVCRSSHCTTAATTTHPPHIAIGLWWSILPYKPARIGTLKHREAVLFDIQAAWASTLAWSTKLDVWFWLVYHGVVDDRAYAYMCEISILPDPPLLPPLRLLLPTTTGGVGW